MNLRPPFAACVALAIVFSAAPARAADPVPSTAQAQGATQAADVAAVEATVDAFAAALQAGDLAKAGELLADDVLVLESGGAERSKAEYLEKHAPADVEFLRNAHAMPMQHKTSVRGDLAWVGSEVMFHTTSDGQMAMIDATETMVLERTPAGWRIVHIHWSSRKES
jgi:ketosteroid isomerase-like protein